MYPSAVFIHLFLLGFFKLSLVFAENAQVQRLHTFFPQVSLAEFQRTRDSELSNAQEYCIQSLKNQSGSAVQVWTVTADDIRMNEDHRHYSFNCDLAYFPNERAMKRSILFQLDQTFDSLLLKSEQTFRPDFQLITEVVRLTKSPYIQITLKNVESTQSVFETSRGSEWIATLSPPQQVGSAVEFTAATFPAHPNSFQTPYTLRVSTQPQPTLELISLTPAAVSSTKFPSHPPPVRNLKFQATQSFLSFPSSFKWGVATSAHQVEGDNTQNDWYLFEQKNGSIFKNAKSGKGPDHWNHVEKDIALLQAMGVHQYRMSIEWSRLEPREGQWDSAATLHYQNEILRLEAHGIEPIITLWHSTLPIWVSQKQGWNWPGIPQAFEKFALYVRQKIAPRARYWITLNEPLLYLMGAYIRGVVPPAELGSFQNIQFPLIQMLRTHAQVYRSLHAVSLPQGPNSIAVGIAHRMDSFAPYDSNSFLDQWISSKADEIFNWTVPQAIHSGQLILKIPFIINLSVALPEIKDTQDYFGLNYYTRFALQTQLFPFDIKEHPLPGTQEITQMGWEIYPEGFYSLLRKVHQKFQSLPILITENGIADASDRLREKYLRRHLTYLYLAIQRGIPVLNYMYWSLYDNFEWDQGYSIHVGLFSIDPTTRRRVSRKSARFFREIVRQNGLPLISALRVKVAH